MSELDWEKNDLNQQTAGQRFLGYKFQAEFQALVEQLPNWTNVLEHSMCTSLLEKGLHYLICRIII